MSGHPRGRLLVVLARTLVYLHGRRYMPDLDVMAAEIGVHKRSLYRYLNALEEAGWVLPRRASDG